MNHTKRYLVNLNMLLAVILLLIVGITPSFSLDDVSYRRVRAADYARWSARLLTAVPVGGTSLTVSPCYFTPNGPGKQFSPFTIYTPITIAGGTLETFTPSAVGTPTYVAGVPGGCEVTVTIAATTYAHNPGAGVVTSGDGGINEAAVAVKNGGIITYDGGSSSNTAIGSLTLAPTSTVIEDLSGAIPHYWTIQPSTLTALATPATRSATAGNTQVISGTAVGTWTAVATYVAVTYVDRLGGESPASASYNFTATASVALNFAAPAASTGAVGWRAYAGVTGTSTMYQLPISSSTCALSTLTPYPTCAMSSAGVFPTPSTTTALAPAAGGVAATYRPNTQSHTTFAYQAQSRLPLSCGSGVQMNYGPFLISPALTAGQAVVLGTVPLPAGCLNSVYKTIHITGRLTLTPSTGGTDQILIGIGDVTDFTTGTPKAICTLTQTTAITTAAQDQYFDCKWTVNATGTTGSIMPSGFSLLQVQAGTTAGAMAVESATAAITADVLDQSTINIEFLQTTAAESTTPPQLQDLHIEEQ